MFRHVASVHEKKKPFKCDFSDYSCTQNRFLSKYVLSVHEKKKPFQCEICDYSCSWKGV